MLVHNNCYDAMALGWYGQPDYQRAVQAVHWKDVRKYLHHDDI